MDKSFRDRIPAEYLQKCPSSFIEDLVRYVDKHTNTGGHFFNAVLINDLSKAFGYAGSEAKAALESCVQLLYNYAPSECWGNPFRVYRWCGEQPVDATAPVTHEDLAGFTCGVCFGNPAGVARVTLRYDEAAHDHA